ncbi:MAG: hypothetical protein BGO51_13650 [Rhodospirillales bacterium 69-11]|nr:hypothetical protein [Rhodospirillales bacterium]OJW26377.1 MAG: hypothetical protein BGO51_13650 [Rhodospirillales bacterium 69-11]
MSTTHATPIEIARQFHEATVRLDEADCTLVRQPDGGPACGELDAKYRMAGRMVRELAELGLESSPTSAAEATALLTFVFDALEIIHGSDLGHMTQTGFLEQKIIQITRAVARSILTLGGAEKVDFSNLGDLDLQWRLRCWVPSEEPRP